MSLSKMGIIILEAMRPKLHKILDKFIDKIKSVRDGDQKSVKSVLTDFKLDMNESLVETLHEECKKNNVCRDGEGVVVEAKLLEHSTSPGTLTRKQKECPIQSSELRSRVRKASAPPQDGDPDKSPSESWWDWVCRMFHSTVQMLREIWQDILRPWLLDCYEAICDTLLPLSNMLKSLSYSV